MGVCTNFVFIRSRRNAYSENIVDGRSIKKIAEGHHSPAIVDVSDGSECLLLLQLDLILHCIHNGLPAGIDGVVADAGGGPRVFSVRPIDFDLHDGMRSLLGFLGFDQSVVDEADGLRQVCKAML